MHVIFTLPIRASLRTDQIKNEDMLTGQGINAIIS